MTKSIFNHHHEASCDLHAKILDTLPFPVFCKKHDGTIKICNTAFARIIGKDKDEIIGKSTLEIMPFNQSDVFAIKDEETLSTDLNQYYETRLKYANGQVRDVIINKYAMHESANDLTDIIGSIIDVTLRKKEQQRLSEAEDVRLISSTMLHKIRAGIVIVDHNLKIIDSNLGFARMIGEDNEELFESIPGLRGAELDMLVPEIIVHLFQSIIESGESRLEQDIKFHNKLLSVSIMTIKRNKVVGAIIRDLSVPMLERAEIIERARKVNIKNMKTVQQIAYLLGENAAQTEELLHSIMESQKYDIDED